MFTVLNNDMLLKKAPSIFATQGAQATSDKYQHISTQAVIAGLSQKGFLPVAAKQSRSLIVDKKSYAKHMIRFRHQDARPSSQGLYPEIVLTNSHDGLPSYRLLSGLYRQVCSNGLMAGHAYSEVRVRHQGDILGQVIEGTYEIINNAQQMLTVAEQMEKITLTKEERLCFAEAAHAIRFEEEDIGQAFHPDKLLRPRRLEEVGKHDLFTTFNIVQENLIKGGVRGLRQDQRGHLKRTSTRAITGIDQDTLLNRALWTLTEKMQALKAN